MKFAIINDIHIGDYCSYKGIYRKANLCAEELLKDFVRKMNKSFKPEFVVQGGDIIEEVNLAADKKNYKKGTGDIIEVELPGISYCWQS